MLLEAYWPKLFAKALSGKDISSFFNFGAVASGPTPAEKRDDKKKDEPKKETPLRLLRKKRYGYG